MIVSDLVWRFVSSSLALTRHRCWSSHFGNYLPYEPLPLLAVTLAINFATKTHGIVQLFAIAYSVLIGLGALTTVALL